MLREAMQYIAGLKEESMDPKVVEINGKTYCNKELKRYDEEPMASAIEATTLTAMIDYIKNCKDELRESMVIHVVNPTTVKLYSGPLFRSSLLTTGTIRNVSSLSCRQILR